MRILKFVPIGSRNELQINRHNNFVGKDRIIKLFLVLIYSEPRRISISQSFIPLINDILSLLLDKLLSFHCNIRISRALKELNFLFALPFLQPPIVFDEPLLIGGQLDRLKLRNLVFLRHESPARCILLKSLHRAAHAPAGDFLEPHALLRNGPHLLFLR